MNEQELKKILKEHKKWLNNKGGKKANLSNANLSNADLSNANLSYANLFNANLSNADLSNANLFNVNLSYANLSYANLSYANLSNAYLFNVNLSNANLSYAYFDYKIKRKMVSNKILMNKMFKRNKKGWLCYKIFDLNYAKSRKWEIEKGLKIKEKLDTNRFVECGFGINVGTKNWIKNNGNDNEIWLVEVPFYAEICVPYWTDGKVRVNECKLIKIVNI